MDREITIASTTEPQEELDRAAQPDWREKGHTVIETPGAPEPGAEVDPETGAESSKSDKEDKSKAGKLFSQAEVDRIVARRLAREKAERSRQEPLPPKETPRTTTNTDPEPTTGTPEHTRWLARQEFREQEAQRDARQRQEAENTRTKEIFDAHQERIAEAREKYTDYDEAQTGVATPWKDNVPADINAARAFQLAIHECDNGPDVLYHLAKHPEKLTALAGKSSNAVIIEVGRISASLLSSAAAPKPKPKSQVSAPVTPVRGGNSVASSVPLGEVKSMAEYNRRRNNGET